MSKHKKQGRNNGQTQWRDADLSPLQLGTKLAGRGRGAQVDRIHRVLSAQRGEAFLKWVQLDAVADLVTELAPENPGTANDSVEFQRLLDPRTRLATELATEMHTSRHVAERFLNEADAMRHRVPESGLLLRDGMIGPRAFTRIVFETEAMIDPKLIAEADRPIADEIRESGQVSPHLVGNAARRIVQQVDAEGARTEREAAKKRKGVRIYPINGGMAVIEIIDSAERVAAVDAALAAIMNQPADESDTRTRDERRADTAVDLLTGKASGADTKVVVHVITDGSTLEGGDQPGHLDGHGTISAEHVRDIAGRKDTLIRPLDLLDVARNPAQAADPYRPTAALDAVVRALHGSCSWPGCSRPASQTQLDHVTEYNHHDPPSGGATDWHNLNPKCVFHHQVKTWSDDWLDDQIVDAHGEIWTEVTTPHGHTIRTRAANTWLFPGLGLLPRATPARDERPDERHDESEPTRSMTRTQAKHAYRMQLRAENRKAAGKTIVADVEVPDDWFIDLGAPPF